MQIYKHKVFSLLILVSLLMSIPVPAFAQYTIWEQEEYNSAVAEGSTERWILVDLNAQNVTAYEGREPVRWFTVSTGKAATPTVTGIFRMWAKIPMQDMSGGDAESGYYYLPDVQWAQYFYGNYGFHGTYWHENFGTPMSRGCVNMTNEDAEWLFRWASPDWRGETTWTFPDAQELGTLVIVRE